MGSSKQAGVTMNRADPGDAPTGKRGRTRRRLLDSTFKLMGHEQGLGVRIEEICADAGVSRGTFYNYFTSMDELFQTLALELSHDFNHAVLATLRQMDDMAESTNAAIQHYLKRARRDAAWGWAMVHLSAMGPFFGAECHEACGQILTQGAKRGEFDIPNVQLARDLVLGTMLAAMISILRDRGGGRVQPKLTSLYLLRALGVAEARAREIAESPLPEVLVKREAR